IVEPAEPDLGSCSGKAGDLGRALARDRVQRNSSQAPERRRAYGWTKEDVDVSNNLCRREFVDKSIHAYWPLAST
ncbi:methyltransferase domain-containing protein, partial [Colletotrichum kahawae]